MATEEEKQLSRGNEKPKSPAKGPLVISINVYSDVLCPWCYVEKRSLEAAMDQFREKHPETKFEVIWKPFYLNPLLKTRMLHSLTLAHSPHSPPSLILTPNYTHLLHAHIHMQSPPTFIHNQNCIHAYIHTRIYTSSPREGEKTKRKTRATLTQTPPSRL